MDLLQRSLLKKRIGYIIYNIFLVVSCFLFNRHVQILIFLLFYDLIQNSFNYRFHADTIFPKEPIKATRYCKIITFGVECLFIVLCKDFHVSVYSNLILILIFSAISALLQNYIVILRASKENKREALIQKCQEAKLSKYATERVILHYIDHKTCRQIARMENVEVETIKQSIRRSRQKLGL